MSEAERQERLERGCDRPWLPGAGRGTVEFADRVRGPQRFASDDIGDFVIRRADGTPPVLFRPRRGRCADGDYHVLRGEDHLTNTPRQLLLLEALGLPAPGIRHLALIVGADGGHCPSARVTSACASCGPPAICQRRWLNYLARLGHAYEQDEWLEPAELAAGFAPEASGPRPARYDEAQLPALQARPVRRADPERLWDWMGSRGP